MSGKKKVGKKRRKKSDETTRGGGGKLWDNYRALYKSVSNYKTSLEFPIQIDFELNATCNLKCPMCPLSVESNSIKKDFSLSFEIFSKIIDEGVKKGLKAVRLNYLNEPLLRADLEEFIKYAKAKGVLDIYFSTNGMLLDKKRAESLIKSGLDRIQISIDANSSEVYSQMRPGGKFNKVVQNVLNLVELKKELNSVTPLVRVNFVRTEINESELESFINFWRDKVDMIGAQEMVAPPKSTKDLKSKTTTKMEKFRCSFPNKNLVITADGNVLPCCTFWGDEMPLGNIYTQIKQSGELCIEKFYNCAKMIALRELHKCGNYQQNEICKKCVEGSLY